MIKDYIEFTKFFQASADGIREFLPGDRIEVTPWNVTDAGNFIYRFGWGSSAGETFVPAEFFKFVRCQLTVVEDNL